MEIIPLKAKPRQLHGKGPARRLRGSGMLPTVAYGRGLQTANLSVEIEALRTILMSVRGRNTVIRLEIEGGEGFTAMVRDFSVHPVSRKLLHADFIRIDENKPVEVEVPFLTTGKAKGELEGGTVLVAMRMLPIRALPDRIPNHLEHDVTELMINDYIKVSEIAVPEGVEVLLPSDRTLVVVQPPRVEAEPEKPAEGEEGAVPAEGEAAAEGEGEKAEGDKKEKGED
jgi:large subunit ribosomal protein L25